MLAIVKRITRRKDKGEGGQTLVEFALVLPIFLLVLFAIVDFGMAFHAWITVTNSAREGGRLGAVQPSLVADGSPCFGYGSHAECIDQKVRDTAGSLGDDLTIDVTNADGVTGESVVVDVTYDYSLITPLTGVLGIGSFSLNSTADFRLE